jgi:folate-binding protein YgfZ
MCYLKLFFVISVFSRWTHRTSICAMLAHGVRLADRRVLRVAGTDALKLLQGVVTNDVRGLGEPGAPPVYAAVLSATGRVSADVFFHREMGEGGGGGGLLLDLPSVSFDESVKLLTKMRLRASVTIDDATSDFSVVAVGDPAGEGGDERSGPRGDRGNTWFGDPSTSGNETTEKKKHHLLSFLPIDPRTRMLGLRGILPAAVAEALVDGNVDGAAKHGDSSERSHDEESASNLYKRFRYELGIGEGDELTGLLPLECNLHWLNAISLTKGCYVGQELVARTHFTGVIRKRIMPAKFNDAGGDFSLKNAKLLLPTAEKSTPDSPSTKPPKSVGKVLCRSENFGLAMVRLEHLTRVNHSVSFARFVVRDDGPRGRDAGVIVKTQKWWAPK